MRILSILLACVLVMAAVPAFAAESGETGTPALKDACAPYFPFGTAVSGRDAANPARMKLYAAQFNLFTPENELKPDSVLDVTASRKLAQADDTAVAVHLSAAKPLLNYAQKNGIPVHGHVLVWYQQTPKAFFHVGYNTNNPYVSREVMLARLENYIKAVFEETEKLYPGVIVSWDVVNEAVDDGRAALRDCTWLKVVGKDYVVRAFEYARKYAPEGVKLYYNDYNTSYEPKQSGIVGVLTALQKAGTVDGYGFQMHHSIDQPSFAAIERGFKRIAAMGLRLRISELDVGIPARTEANLKAQAAVYGQVTKLALAYADQVEGVQVWGVTDNVSWRAKQFPLLFDANMQPKPAFYAVLEAVGQK